MGASGHRLSRAEQRLLRLVDHTEVDRGLRGAQRVADLGSGQQRLTGSHDDDRCQPCRDQGEEYAGRRIAHDQDPGAEPPDGIDGVLGVQVVVGAAAHHHEVVGLEGRDEDLAGRPVGEPLDELVTDRGLAEASEEGDPVAVGPHGSHDLNRASGPGRGPGTVACVPAVGPRRRALEPHGLVRTGQMRRGQHQIDVEAADDHDTRPAGHGMARSGSTAVPEISSSTPSSTSPATYTAVLAGGTAPAPSRRLRTCDTALKSSRRVR